uniref:UDP-glucuronosyltransferase n=1 Tax=Anopheles atroparvus TaxID=41427 RepID=A0A182IQA4_ANOAO
MLSTWRKREMARKLSIAYRNRPQTPLELAIWAILNVIENGAERFERSYGAALPWIIYYSLDVILVLATIIGAMTISVWYLLKYMFFKAPKQGKDLSSKKRRVKAKKL